MSRPLLSILIPTVLGREDVCNRLVGKILRTRNGNEAVATTYFDNKEMTIGEKREKMYRTSNGIFSWQIDDDDDIPEDAIKKILGAIKSNPEVDCITFEEYVSIDGNEYKSNHSLEYHDWEGDGQKEFSDGFHFHRTPFFKSVVRTGIAKSVPIPFIRFGEDHQWAQALKPILKTEIHIPEQLYRYTHISTPFNERYGFDRNA